MLASKAKKRESGVWLVWCYEHCLQQEQDSVRKELKQLAASTPKCKFVCHKKSKDFLRWQEGRERSTLLIADWREVKPIMEGVRRSDSQSFSLCVVTQTETAFNRASRWADEQGTGEDIVVTLGLSLQATRGFIARNTQKVHEPSHEDVPLIPVPMQPKIMDASCWLSLPNLLKAVRDPVQACRLEELIQKTMWQTYED